MTDESKQLDLKKLYRTQISLTEWFAGINHHLSNELRDEDNEKRERLSVLNKTVGIPFDKPVKFTADDVSNRSEAFLEYLAGHGNELCAMRLIPTNPSLPKLRMRGQTVMEVVKNWYPGQKIDPSNYRVDFMPHSDNYLWSTIFIVNKNRIFGEIIDGTHAQLTQGFHEKEKPIIFSFDFNKLELDRPDPGAKKHLEILLNFLLIRDKSTQQELKEKLNATFSHDYLMGYFETATCKDFGIWFCDYNRILGTLYSDYNQPLANESDRDHQNILTGQSGSHGKVKGKVKIINNPNDEFNDGDILVCSMTTPDFIPIMNRSSAIITDLGGILSHAAIIARELKKPCIVGTKTATISLKDGMEIEIDADTGSIKIIK